MMARKDAQFDDVMNKARRQLTILAGAERFPYPIMDFGERRQWAAWADTALAANQYLRWLAGTWPRRPDIGTASRLGEQIVMLIMRVVDPANHGPAHGEERRAIARRAKEALGLLDADSRAHKAVPPPSFPRRRPPLTVIRRYDYLPAGLSRWIAYAELSDGRLLKATGIDRLEANGDLDILITNAGAALKGR